MTSLRPAVPAGAAFLVLLTGLHAVAKAPADRPSGFEPGFTSFRVSVGDLENTYDVFAVSVLPQDTLRFTISSATSPDSFALLAPSSARRDALNREWLWRAPKEPGLSVLRIVNLAVGDTMTLNVFTMAPAGAVKKGMLNGYRIGSYPSGREEMKPPAGFIEVREEHLDARVSPHFTLGQFLSRLESGYPRYLVLDTGLVMYLEELLAEVNRRGHAASTFAVLSGYRTPHHNRQKRNVRYSQHQWGKAADIYIDHSPRDGMMDDLNGDGVSNRKDAQVLAAIVESLDASGRHAGGMGSYRGTRSHGPFIHVDVRGTRVRW